MKIGATNLEICYFVEFNVIWVPLALAKVEGQRSEAFLGPEWLNTWCSPKRKEKRKSDGYTGPSLSCRLTRVFEPWHSSAMKFESPIHAFFPVVHMPRAKKHGEDTGTNDVCCIPGQRYCSGQLWVYVSFSPPPPSLSFVLALSFVCDHLSSCFSNNVARG